LYCVQAQCKAHVPSTSPWSFGTWSCTLYPLSLGQRTRGLSVQDRCGPSTGPRGVVEGSTIPRTVLDRTVQCNPGRLNRLVLAVAASTRVSTAVLMNVAALSPGPLVLGSKDQGLRTPPLPVMHAWGRVRLAEQPVVSSCQSTTATRAASCRTSDWLCGSFPWMWIRHNRKSLSVYLINFTRYLFTGFSPHFNQGWLRLSIANDRY